MRAPLISQTRIVDVESHNLFTELRDVLVNDGSDCLQLGMGLLALAAAHEEQSTDRRGAKATEKQESRPDTRCVTCLTRNALSRACDK